MTQASLLATRFARKISDVTSINARPDSILLAGSWVPCCSRSRLHPGRTGEGTSGAQLAQLLRCARAPAAHRDSETCREENWSPSATQGASRDGSAVSAFGRKSERLNRCIVSQVQRGMELSRVLWSSTHIARGCAVSSRAPPHRLIQLTARRHGSSAVTQKRSRVGASCHGPNVGRSLRRPKHSEAAGTC